MSLRQMPLSAPRSPKNTRTRPSADTAGHVAVPSLVSWRGSLPSAAADQSVRCPCRARPKMNRRPSGIRHLVQPDGDIEPDADQRPAVVADADVPVFDDIVGHVTQRPRRVRLKVQLAAVAG